MHWSVKRCFNYSILLLAGIGYSAPSTRGAEKAETSIERMKKDLFFLAGEECEGRGVETKGINKAADHIAATFKELGLKSAPTDGSYFQPFPINGPGKLGAPNKLTIQGPLGQTISAPFNKLFSVCGFSGKGKAFAPLVFAGYGISSKDGYDDYAGLDVKGKIVVVLRATPRATSKESPFPNFGDYAPLTHKIETAEKNKAAAILFVSERSQAGADDALMTFDYVRGTGAGSIPLLHIRRALLDQMLATESKSLATLEDDIDRELKPRSFELKGWSADLEATVERTEIPAKNVVAVLEGKGPLANETIVIGAHYDHLGRGEVGTRSRGSKDVHFGADDNGSGTTAVLELARRFAAMKDREGRRIVFMTFSGEERGLLGSRHYCSNPLVPLDKTVAMINLDMIGRLGFDKVKNRLEIGGVGSAKSFENIIDELNKTHKLDIKKSRSGTGPSDHTSFYLKGVPVFFFFTGLHEEYHRPSDKPDTINFEGMKKVVDMVEELAVKLTTDKQKPEYIGGSVASSGAVPSIRFVPGNYDGDELKGVLVGDVIPGGPAEKAGIKKDDWIIEIAGQSVKNMDGYMKVMGTQKAGETIDFTIKRGEEKVKLKVTALPGMKKKD